MAGTPNPVGFTADSPKHFLLNSGAIYINYGLADERVFGAVAPGNEFNVSMKYQNIKVGGITNSNVKGLQFLTDLTVSLKVNMLEVTTEIFMASLPGSVVDSTSVDYDIITLPMGGNQSYITNIALVSTLSGSDNPVVIILKNAQATSGLKIKLEDAKDNVVPMEFLAFSDPLNPKDSPFEIHYPKIDSVSTDSYIFLMEAPIMDNGKILLTFSSYIDTPVYADGFTVTTNGVANAITAIKVGVNRLYTLELTLATTPTSGQSVTIAYTIPLTNKITSGGVPLETFDEQTVINH